MARRRIGFTFRPVFLGGRNMPGSIEVDFLVDYFGEYFFVQVDGEYAHKSAAQRQRDAMNDAILWDAFMETLAAPVIRIKYDELINQENADFEVEELFPL